MSACFSHISSAFLSLLGDCIFINAQEKHSRRKKPDTEFEDSPWQISRRAKDREEGRNRGGGGARGRGGVEGEGEREERY